VTTAGYRKIVDRFEPVEGGSRIRWDLKDDLGRDVSNGIYFLKMDGSVGSASRIVVLK
jgi:hypothetical protein